jgi:hypothetical protein
LVVVANGTYGITIGIGSRTNGCRMTGGGEGSLVLGSVLVGEGKVIGVGCPVGEGILCGCDVGDRTRPAVFAGSIYRKAGAVWITKVSGRVRAGGTGWAAVTGGTDTSIPCDKTCSSLFFCLLLSLQNTREIISLNHINKIEIA